MFRLPMVPRMLAQLFKKPATNPFPATHLPKSMSEFLEHVENGKAIINPPVEVPEGFKGKIAYDQTDCTGCALCARVCPANAIEVFKPEKRIVVYLGHCIQCSQCIEACNKNSLVMTKDFLTATTDRYSKDMIAE